MTIKRLVACLDVKAGRVVKGVSFGDLRDVGDPVELARRYEAEGADEVVFLDVSASAEERAPLWDIATRTAEQLFVPLTIGGGLGSLADAQRALRAGADKVAFNSAAVRDPGIVTACAQALGAQCVMVSIDARWDGSGWRVFTHGGTRPTGLDAVQWARRVVQAGAGELLVTSIDRDGQRCGYDLELTRAIADAVAVPVIASGGAGTAAHVVDAFVVGHADAALLAGILHDGTTTVGALKAQLQQAGLDVRTSRPVSAFAFDLDAVDFSKGLVPVVAQDATTGAVLMVAYADRQALGKTIETGRMHYRSRTRGLWQKGETSGNVQQVVSLTLDCDGDTVLARVQPAGPACHTGQRTCFGASTGDELSQLAATLAERAITPREGSYTTKLLGSRNLRLKKLGEEAAELVLALADGDGDAAVEEAADVVYHVLVALQAQGRTLDDVRAVLARRRVGMGG